MPVVHREELRLDKFSDDRDVTVAERIADDVACRRRKKDHRNRADNAGHRKRQSNRNKGLPRFRAKVGTCFGIAFVDFQNNRVKRHNDERKIVVNHADKGIHKAETVRFVHTDEVKQLFHCGSSQNEVDPERKNEENKENSAFIELRFCENICDRISDEKAYDSRDYRKAETYKKNSDIRLFREEIREIGDREGNRFSGDRESLAPCRNFLRESIQNYKQERYDDERDEKNCVGNTQLLS